MADQNSIKSPKLSGDIPLSDPSLDRLGYDSFARQLASSIRHMAPTEGLVMGLYGPWGSGKSTLLNFIVYYLDDLPDDECPILVRFNPWWFAGHEDLIRRFFDQLEAVVKKWHIVGTKAREALASLGDLVSNVPIATVAAGGRIVARTRPKLRDVEEARKSISSALRGQDKKILVVIDDIDRLAAEEVREVFRLVKSVANFPNVVYLLAFAKEVAVKAVESVQNLPGEEYLEKIIQVPFELPLPDKPALRQLLFEKLDVLLADVPERHFDVRYWREVYFNGIDHYISTPRDVTRLTNTLAITYHPEIRTEVNAVDFIAIETLRVFSSFVYDVLRRNPDQFVGAETSSGLDIPIDRVRPFHDSWLEEVQEAHREAVRKLMQLLFPKLNTVWGNTVYGSGDEKNWRADLRVCSPERFPTYFRLAVPEGSVSNAEIQGILALTGDTQAFATMLLELSKQRRPDGTVRVSTVLERMEDYTREQISEDHIGPIVSALYDVGDELLVAEEEPRALLDFSNEIRIARVSHQLLRRLPEPSRFEILREGVSNGRAVAVIASEIAILGQEHGKLSERNPTPEEERTVSAAHLEQLEALALEKFRSAANSGLLLENPRLASVLYRWRDWAGEDEARAWVEEAVESDAGLIRILEVFLQTRLTQAMDDLAPTRSYRFDLQVLEPFLDVTTVVDRARRIDTGRLTDRARTAVEQFIAASDRGEDEEEEL